MIKNKIVCFFIIVIFFVGFSGSVNAENDSAFEFSNYISSDLYSREKLVGFSRGNNQCSYVFSTKIDIMPEECRFYLNYTGTGKSNFDLLKEAETVKNSILESMKSVDRENIIVEMASYNPEQYMGSFFKSQKEELVLQFRVIVKLEKDFWNNSKKIAKVLDIINDVKKDQKLGKNLTQGDVRYAVKHVEPFVQELLTKTEEKINGLKKSILNVNKIGENELFFNVTYNEIYVAEQTLEKITLVLPYTYSCELKK